MIYQWKAGAVVKASAEDAGAQCEALSRAGKLTPAALVDLNRPEDAPLHNAFEWRRRNTGSHRRGTLSRIWLVSWTRCRSSPSGRL